ncbi:hypothetical protein [Rhizobium leucaenae]|uniref:phage adaptor protein n=1 Tax=Rhizobium leucaenae TaxID=29450 RepID=UPI0016136CF4|nr:hypothetical protein [Rhizobium leucaenae]MBB6304045.1 hypothetical protein [Rhizobium leucaenae]
MSLLSVCQNASLVIGLDKPDVIASSTDRPYQELFRLANEMAERISRGHEWQLFSTVCTLTGNGSLIDFDLPADYDRMVTEANVWSSALETPLSRVEDIDEWLGFQVQSFDFVINAWIIFGNEMHIKPAMPTGETAQFFYQSNLIVKPSGGSNKARFTADTDTFRLDEQLLELGIIWQWRANKGLPYAEDMASYESLLERLVSRDKGAKILRSGRKRVSRGVKIAYPRAITP